MDRKEELYLAMIEGTASEEQVVELDLLEQSAEGNRYAEYRGVDKLCKLLGQEELRLDEEFSLEVLDKIQSEKREEDGVYQDFYLAHGRTLVLSLSGFASALAVVLLMLIVRFPEAPGKAMHAMLSEHSLQSSSELVQLHVLAAQGRTPEQESFVHVSVALDEATDEIDIAHFLPVRKSEKVSKEAGNLIRITVEASHEIAESIRRARYVGQLRVMPVISQSTQVTPESVSPKTLLDPFGRKVSDRLPGVTNAVVYLREEQSGLRTRHVFENGSWYAMEKTELLAF